MEKGMEMNKGRALCMLGALFTALLLCACGERENPETEKTKTEITVMNGWGSTEKDHQAMQQIYLDFQKENPDVTLKLVSMPTSEEMIRKAEDRIMVGDIPDVIFCGDAGKDSLYRFMVKEGLALDLMPYIEADREFLENIAPANISYWKTPSGELYTISDVVMLSGGYWYNEEIFEKAGVKELPQTWEEMEAVCRRISRWAKREKEDVLPLNPTAEGYLYFIDQMMSKNKGRCSVAVSQNKIALDGEELQEIFLQLQKLHRYTGEREGDYSYRDETDLFNEGKLAMYVNGAWGAFMIDEDIQASYALLPHGQGMHVACESTGLGFVLGNTKNEKKIQASIRFLKYMLDEKVQERILLETGQASANPNIHIEEYAAKMPRFCRAAELVRNAEIKIEVPVNLWGELGETDCQNLFSVLEKEMDTETFIAHLKNNSQFK